jgi:hypothetical protein
MTRNTAAHTHRTRRPVHGEKVLGSGGPEASVAPILRGMYRARSLLSQPGSAAGMRGTKSRTPAKALIAPAMWQMMVASPSENSPMTQR